MYETLLRLWQEGKITASKLTIAVGKGYITEEQKQNIVTLSTP
jgi:hypothetical protein